MFSLANDKLKNEWRTSRQSLLTPTKIILSGEEKWSRVVAALNPETTKLYHLSSTKATAEALVDRASNLMQGRKLLKLNKD